MITRLCGAHSEKHINIELLYYTPEINRKLYTNYA